MEEFYMEEATMGSFTMLIITMEGSGRVPCYHILPSTGARPLSKYFSRFIIVT